jgi:hypothetical protein
MATKTKPAETQVEQFKAESWNPNNKKWFVWRENNGLTEYLNRDGQWRHVNDCFYDTKEAAIAAVNTK